MTACRRIGKAADSEIVEVHDWRIIRFRADFSSILMKATQMDDAIRPESHLLRLLSLF